MHMQRTQPEQLGVLYIYRLISTYQVSSARLESRVLNHMKIVVPPPGIEPGPSTFRAGVLPLGVVVSLSLTLINRIVVNTWRVVNVVLPLLTEILAPLTARPVKKLY